MKTMKKFIIFMSVSVGVLSTASLLSMNPKKYVKKQGEKIRRAGQSALQWVENAGQAVLGNVPPTIQALTNKDYMDLFIHLPQDIQRFILSALIDVYDATNLSTAARAITDLTRINNDLFRLINQPTFHKNLVDHLSQKFGERKVVVARELGTQAAKYQLKKHAEMMDMIAEFDSKSKKSFEKLEKFFAQNSFEINSTIVNWQGLGGIPPLSKAIIDEELSLVQLLMKYGADPMQLMGGGRTPFMLAAIHANGSEKIREILNVMIPALKPGQIDQLDELRMNALSYAIQNRDIITVKILLDAGADPAYENIPLARAGLVGNQAISDLLKNAMKKE